MSRNASLQLDPKLAAGAVPSWSAMTPCVSGCSSISSSAVLPSRWPGAWHWKLDGPSSPTSEHLPVHPCPDPQEQELLAPFSAIGPSPNGAGGDAKGDTLRLADHDAVRQKRTGCPPLHERHYVIALRQNGKAADPIASAMSQVLGAFPPQWRRSVAFDNGTEFARITGSMPWTSRPSSAIPIPLGRREGWRMPSGMRRVLPQGGLGGADRRCI